MENICCVTPLPVLIVPVQSSSHLLCSFLILIKIGQAEQFQKWMAHRHLSVTHPALWDSEHFLGCNKWINHNSVKMGTVVLNEHHRWFLRQKMSQ